MNDKIDFTSIYATPAQIQDFPDNKSLQEQMDNLWDQGLDAANQASTVSNPWTATNQAPCNWYVNRKDVSFPLSTHIVEPVFWTAFPNRLKLYFSQTEKSPYAFTNEQVLHLADFGDIDYNGDIPKDPSNDGLPFKIPSQTCPQMSWEQASSDWKGYDPYGPRGWLDEYCEWAVTRNPQGQIIAINFTCENPEYWYTLWKVDPQRVAELYNELLSTDTTITVEDLQLKDSKENIVIDPFTNAPAYNPLNKWNKGTIATNIGGGAVHLTSPPNTIGAEILLAAQATLLRELAPDNYNMQSLVCAGAFGRPYRNSDPHIGLQVNQVIKNVGVKIMLTNPLGLYLQAPDFSNYTFPEGTCVNDWFSVVRGRRANTDGESYDQILHMKFHAPTGYTLEDVTIGALVEGSANGPSQTPQPIQYAGQIADTFKVAIAATAVPQPEGTPVQIPLPPVGNKNGESDGYPSMIIGNQVFEAMTAVNPNPPFVALPVYLNPSQTYQDILMQVSYVSDSDNVNQATIEIYNSDSTAIDPNITITLKKVTNSDGTPVGGGSGSNGGLYNFFVTIAVAAGTTPGLRGILIKNQAATEAPTPLPGLIYINA
ncbi:conserved hypothetical protein [Shewanella denitrificans OS217]|uniref:Uncharacterized protein n=1 Tax=Shewanella denitrificans (strain OS217 / ATCC BAA-1090 / DSM 15013) TaxID=318161 RepID=Q12MG2_SHEDO|nr:hypothetical protein [Shewanella denitrificans]ABE55364.1 conserved hypothetical protein [Shewanella denitrificans OS217]